MFCPKCGVENPSNVKFCRKCGCDLSLVSDAISGKLTVSGEDKLKKNKKKANWEEALTLLSISVAFFIVSAILAFQPMAAFWWFWLLIPAFVTLATGIGKVITLKQDQRNDINIGSGENAALPRSETTTALPPKQTEFVSDPVHTTRQPEFAPPSVVEGTTRNLELDTEGETINLPKTDA